MSILFFCKKTLSCSQIIFSSAGQSNVCGRNRKEPKTSFSMYKAFNAVSSYNNLTDLNLRSQALRGKTNDLISIKNPLKPLTRKSSNPLTQ